jgi:putative addiction module killer protein
MVRFRVQRSKQYKAWYKSLTEKERGIVDTRVDTYRFQGELKQSKSLDVSYSLYEFKWNSGLRVYYSFIEDINGQLMLLLLGGNKNSQQSDIAEAKKIVLKAVERIVIKGRKK